MRQIVSVWLPRLPTDRIRATAESPRPLAVVAHEGNRQVLTAVDRAAAEQGLTVGMPLVQARALVSDLAVCGRDLDGDAMALEQLAAWCLRYAPLVAPDSPDGIWIDATGCTHLFGGARRLLRDLLDRLAGQGLEARAGIAETPGAAWATAHFLASRQNPAVIIPPGEQAAALALLPIEALRLPPHATQTFRLLGLEIIADLAAVPSASLIRRHGTRLVTRWNQALGLTPEPIAFFLGPSGQTQARENFADPLSGTEAFAAAITRLTGTLCAELEHQAMGAHRLDLLFECVDGTVAALRVTTTRPSRDARHLGRMLRERLERLTLAAGVEAMRLVATRTSPLVSTTDTLLPEDRAGRVPAELTDRLINRLGHRTVYRVTATGSRVPERSARQASPLASAARSDGASAGLIRPVRLLAEPNPIEALVSSPDDLPITFTWRRIRHHARHVAGPERIAGEWWKRDGETHMVRDYYRVEDEAGRRFWLYRRGDGTNPETGDGRWFLHGFF